MDSLSNCGTGTCHVLWMAARTLAANSNYCQYFIESPSYTDSRQWEQFLFQLLGPSRLPFSSFAALSDALPSTLAHIEVQFAAISQAFDIKTYNPSPAYGVVYVSPLSPRYL